jgi:5-methylcytosine-specific restriction endonuclease McrA
MSSRVGYIRKRWKKRIELGEVILCALCHQPIPAKSRGTHKIKNGGKGSVSVDHIIPKSLGGKSTIDNLQPTHALCNWKRGNKLL